jgi:5-deoxy-glucuronate isomerase
VLALAPGESFARETGAREVALTSLRGYARVAVGGETFPFGRKDVFDEIAHVLYVPPRQSITITAETEFECALGGAPAQGKYPVRLITPDEMPRELRGKGAAQRQVHYLLTHPLPAERLILYEGYLPGGMWGGIPPHCHDGTLGSPYLEEVYYYRITPVNGFVLHRNYSRGDTGTEPLEETFAVADGDLVLVPRGFHPVAAPPGSNVYFLNYLAGDLLDEARGTPPVDDPEYAWLKQNWGGNALELPLFGNPT